MESPEIPSTHEGTSPNLYETDATLGFEEISICDENEDGSDGLESGGDENGVGGCNFGPETAVNSMDDLGKINLNEISPQDLMRYHFPDAAVGFLFYNWYASMTGFAARKSKLMRNSTGEITQQTFLCHREGHREAKYTNTVSRRREPKPNTRCGYDARCVVHIEYTSCRWYIKYFNDVHNHTMLDEKFRGMLPAHRKMSEYDKFQMNTMRNVGIRTPHIYGLFASQAGGFEKVGFLKRDMYNEQLRQRQTHFSDAKAALDFLEGLRADDETFFWKHTIDDEGRLKNLFWCDSIGRRDYSVFGDVLAFDATYRKNKYLCPLVVFSGVNHHIQSIVFAGAIVGNETEETYVWLLQQFLEAMGGKSPNSVITDGDVAMRNAIKVVFPHAHHRLCAWHLIRNATSNVKNPKFVSMFKKCMLGDYDVGEFKQKWEKMVAEFGLHENIWVKEPYEKRRMWATAHIRGNFFAGFRTTSRCEGLHSEFGKYVNFQNNLLDFLQHFFRWLKYMRFREVEADFTSSHGEPVYQTELRFLEKLAANVYTREVFMLFRPVLQRACTCRVVSTKQTTTCFMYRVCKYRKDGFEWHVSYCPSSLQFRCSCERMESLGIPCEHLVSVLVYLNIVQMPECLVLSRWTKTAKDSPGVYNKDISCSRDPALISQYVYVVERCKRMATAALECGRPEYMRKTFELVDAHTAMLEAAGSGDNKAPPDADPCFEDTIRNPHRVRTKGCGGAPSSSQKTTRRAQTCGVCGVKGHNRKSCHVHQDLEILSSTQPGSSAGFIVEDYLNEDYDCTNIDMVTTLFNFLL